MHIGSGEKKSVTCEQKQKSPNYDVKRIPTNCSNGVQILFFIHSNLKIEIHLFFFLSSFSVFFLFDVAVDYCYYYYYYYYYNYYFCCCCCCLFVVVVIIYLCFVCIVAVKRRWWWDEGNGRCWPRCLTRFRNRTMRIEHSAGRPNRCRDCRNRSRLLHLQHPQHELALKRAGW